ncbi:MAG: dockerin type I repeat-containing protein, partial [Candidatus Neomarinimicrobiota bacterium]|nr:dockerin type I repeat-containing protein [Candidatus Neomarinimicrobiota bacterium]
VNNTRQDLTPYFLTAWHCIEGENPNTFRFYFNKEASACENTWGSAGPYAYGSDLVADSNGINGADWALLLIDDDIDEDWGVFYAGWDATENYPLISCGVHHPGGSGKKINYDNDIAYGDWWNGEDAGTPGILTHWKVNWDQGGTEGGSSGSPLFNDRFQIVGVLTGGSGDCGQGSDLYGKFYYGWNWELESNRRLIDWLDPDYTGALVIDGTYVEVTGILGDLNSDDSLNILDIIVLVNLILDDDIMNEDLQLADLNEDGMLNILDIIVLANIIISS